MSGGAHYRIAWVEDRWCLLCGGYTQVGEFVEQIWDDQVNPKWLQELLRSFHENRLLPRSV